MLEASQQLKQQQQQQQQQLLQQVSILSAKSLACSQLYYQADIENETMKNEFLQNLTVRGIKSIGLWSKKLFGQTLTGGDKGRQGP